MHPDEREKEDHDLFEIAQRLKKDEMIRNQVEEQERQTLEKQRRAVRREELHDLGVDRRADDYVGARPPPLGHPR